MKHSKQQRAAAIQDSIRNVLFQSWDPIGVNPDLQLRDEYDSYIAPVYRVLMGTRSESDLIGLLQDIECDRIGMRSAGADQLRSVAKKLLTLDVKL